MEGFDCRSVELQQWFTAGTDHVCVGSICIFCPLTFRCGSKISCTLKLATVTPVRADEFRIAKSTNGLFPMLLTTGPQIATGKTQEYGWPACLCALALQRVVNFLD